MDNKKQIEFVPSTLTCEQFQEQLPELFEGGADLRSNPHLRTCDKCSALVRDLEYIAEQARLLLTPVEEPSPAIWKKIEDALREEVKLNSHTPPAVIPSPTVAKRT